MTTSDNEWQRVKSTSGTMSDNEDNERQQFTTRHDEWQRVTTTDNEWQRVVQRIITSGTTKRKQ